MSRTRSGRAPSTDIALACTTRAPLAASWYRTLSPCKRLLGRHIVHTHIGIREGVRRRAARDTARAGPRTFPLAYWDEVRPIACKPKRTFSARRDRRLSGRRPATMRDAPWRASWRRLEPRSRWIGRSAQSRLVLREGMTASPARRAISSQTQDRRRPASLRRWPSTTRRPCQQPTALPSERRRTSFLAAPRLPLAGAAQPPFWLPSHNTRKRERRRKPRHIFALIAAPRLEPGGVQLARRAPSRHHSPPATTRRAGAPNEHEASSFHSFL